MVHHDSRSYSPVVLVMEVDSNNIASPHEEVSSYVTYGYIARSGDSYIVRAYKKSIIVNQQQIEMFEIYGEVLQPTLVVFWTKSACGQGGLFNNHQGSRVFSDRARP